MAMVSFCSTSSTDTPRAQMPRIMSVTTSTIFGARPSVGSSIRMTRGLPSSERHMVSICCSPPESMPAAVVRRSFSCGKNWYISATVHVGTPARGACMPMRMFSSTVTLWKISRSSGT